MNVLVTITYNALSHDILPGFFRSIEAQDDRDFVLLVVDNASTDGTREYLQGLDLPCLRLILNDENVGFGRACNQGIEFARSVGAEHITFINNDVEFGPDLIGGMVASLERTGAAALTPLITPYDHPDQIWFIGGSFQWRRGYTPHHHLIWQPRNKASRELIQVTEFATGCCLLIRMSVFDVVPGFDDRFFVYWEDADLSMTLRAKGLRIVVDTTLELRHKVSTSTGGLFGAFSVFHAVRGYLLFIRKYKGRGGLAFAIPFAVAKLLRNVLAGRIAFGLLPAWFNGFRSGLRG